MLLAERIDDPMITVVVRDQRPDAHDRMVDVLKFVADCSADFVIIFAIKIIGGGESA
jgi:hypothetical protein